MYIREINEFTIIWGKLNMKRKIACVLLGAVSLQLLSCGQHESNETLTEPNYVLQEYETTKSENGYSIVIFFKFIQKIIQFVAIKFLAKFLFK